MNDIDYQIMPVGVLTLLRLRRLINMSELARLSGIHKQTLIARLRRAEEAIRAGEDPSEIPNEDGIKIHECLLSLGINVVDNIL